MCSQIFDMWYKKQDEVYNEALAIYHITYDCANHRRDAKYCFFVWRIASSALLKSYAKKQDERSLPLDVECCSLGRYI